MKFEILTECHCCGEHRVTRVLNYFGYVPDENWCEECYNEFHSSDEPRPDWDDFKLTNGIVDV